MGTNEHLDHDANVNAVHHEVRDVNARPVLLFAIMLILLVAFTFWMSRILFNYLAGREISSHPPLSPLADQRPQMAPEPRLQLRPVQAKKAIQAAEENLLHSYGWADESGRVVRIPIERAMELLSQRGLPARAGGASTAGDGPAGGGGGDQRSSEGGAVSTGGESREEQR